MKAKKPLTDRAIRAAKPAEPGKRRLLWDAIVPGLAIRVTDQGAKSFVLVTRYPGASNPTPRSLGKYGAVSLAEARTNAQGWLKQIAAGVDPGVAEIQRRQETFQAITEEYLAREGGKLRTLEWRKEVLARLVYPTLGPRPIGDIRRSDIIRLLDRIEDERGPVMADRTLEIIRKVMNWYASRSDEFRTPIVRGMARTKTKDRARQRTLTDDELRAIWTAAVGPFGAMVKFILLTATRRSEASKAKRSEIDGGDWTIPAARYKTGTDHLIPLSKMAQALLDNDRVDWLFTTDGRTPISGFSTFKRRLDEASGVTGWTIHDLRRTARSLMSKAGVQSDHAERALGHAMAGIRGTYDRYEFYEEKRRAFEALASLIERIVNPQENVVGIRQGGKQ